jgi:hypothetical protein
MNHLRHAELSKSKLHREIFVDYEGKVTVRPYDSYNQLKNALALVEDSFLNLTEEQKKPFETNLDEIKILKSRSIYFIEGISAGLKIEEKRARLEGAIASGSLTDIKHSYHSLSSLIRRQAPFLYKIYGKTT